MEQRFLQFIYEFHVTRDFFKCHELLEELWIEQTQCQTKENVYVLLLQVAVGAYHHRAHNHVGANKLYHNALQYFEKLTTHLEDLGIDPVQLELLIHQQITAIELKTNYSDYQLPLKDVLFERYLKQYHLTINNWYHKSDFTNKRLINHYDKS